MNSYIELRLTINWTFQQGDTYARNQATYQYSGLLINMSMLMFYE